MWPVVVCKRKRFCWDKMISFHGRGEFLSSIFLISIFHQTFSAKIIMKILHSVHPDDFKTYGTDKIRERFLLSDLKQNGQANFVYTHYDRMVAGLIKPDGKTISLETDNALKSEYFLERREIGIINVGGEGKINADGKSYTLNKLDCLYIGKGVKQVDFSGGKADASPIFFILSNPAHASYPTTLMKHDDSLKAVLGSQATANQRTLCKY